MEARLAPDGEAAPARLAPVPPAPIPPPAPLARVAPTPVPPPPPPEPSPPAEAGEDSEANWPSATEEAAFLNGPREEINLPVLPPEPARAAGDTEPVPPFEELIQQIPAEVRATLEELFRARFNRVMRAKPKTA